MRIVIKYDSSWQTSFLGDDTKRPISTKRNKNTNLHNSHGYMQKFVATSKSRGEKNTPITDSTVLGVLCRLIGDQRKLYQARNNGNFYFADIENSISWRLEKSQSASELMYLTNKSDDRCGQGTWLGVLSNDNPWFFSKVSPQLWSVIYLNRDNLLDFILGEMASEQTETTDVDNCQPKKLLARLDLITKSDSGEGKPWINTERFIANRMKLTENLEDLERKKSKHIANSETRPPKTDKQKVSYQKKLIGFENKMEDLGRNIYLLGDENEIAEIEKKLNKVTNLLGEKFPGNEYWDNGFMYPSRLYAAALYLQIEYMKEGGCNLEFAINKKGEIQVQGFSKRGFNCVRDWLNPMTGGRKKAVGTPCMIQKQSGQLEITIDIDKDRASELKNMIDCAGVSSFYLGKKGLAYVSKIRV